MNDNYLIKLRKRYADGEMLLRQTSGERREMLSVAAFLELSGIDFNPEQLCSSESQPPDVVFKYATYRAPRPESCNFEVTEVLPEHIRRHDGMSDAIEAIDGCIAENRSSSEYVSQNGPILKSKTPMTLDCFQASLRKAVHKKNEHYRKRMNKPVNIGELDLLIVVQLSDRFLMAEQVDMGLDDTMIHPWRSVSFIMEPFCGVIYTGTNCPSLLKNVHKRNLIFNNKPEIWDDMITKLCMTAV
ncbi:MAG: DUF1780 domain-containing protein [Syntrophales bacterium]